MQGLSVDWLYRDVRKVAGIIDDCSAGRIEIAYQPGHPHGFVTHIYMAEIAHCQILWDPTGVLAELKSRTTPYPSQLKDAIIAEFFWEAQFSILIARKGISRADTTYTAGCCFRCIACLMQTLFALNGRYQMNEKGSVEQATAFPLSPPDLRARIDTVFGRLDAESAAVQDAIDMLETIVHDVGR